MNFIYTGTFFNVDRKERKMKLPPSNKSITENGETDSLMGDTSALDSVVNTKYKDKKKKKKHKRDEGMKNGRTLNELEPMGLPVMDKPNAGRLTYCAQVWMQH